MTTNPKDFLLNTDYELDKIVLVKTGSFTNSVDISHTLSFTPLAFGVWSFDSNFTTTNSLGDSALATEYGYTPPTTVNCRSFSNKITLKASGENATTATIYYRLYAMAPPGTNADAPTTSDLANQFILNTDYNYRKLNATGTFAQPGQSYSHNLGYLPQVMAWVQYKNLPDLPNYNRAIQPMLTSASDYGIIVTNSAIRLPTDFPFELIDSVIWRIYYDEA